MKAEKFVLVAALAAGFCVDLHGTVIEVPEGDVTALTNAFATATRNFDEIAIAPGIYNLKGVKMTADSHLSIGGTGNPVQRKIYGTGAKAGDTVLVGGGEDDSARVMYVFGSGVQITNLTVTGGYGTYGGGIRISGGGIADCVITNNVSRSGGGGGVYIENGNSAVRCLIADNTSVKGYGGGLSGASTVDCVISNNVMQQSDANLGGGGAYGGVSHRRTRFYFNRAPSAPGGAFSSYNGAGSDYVFDSCLFVSNTANSRQMAVSKAILTNCVFVGGTVSIGNADTRYLDTDIICMNGGAAVLNGGTCERCVISNCVMASGNASFISSTTLKNCLLVDLRNTGASNAGFVGVGVSGSKLYNCTIDGFWRKYSNYGAVDGASVCVNTIITGSSPQDLVGGGNTPTMTNCFWTSQSGTLAAEKICGGGMMTSAALKFADAANGDFTLTRKSPARNAGWSDAAYLTAVGPVDLDGNNRVYAGDEKSVIDIGCYEYSLLPPGFKVIFR